MTENVPPFTDRAREIVDAAAALEVAKAEFYLQQIAVILDRRGPLDEIAEVITEWRNLK